MTVKKTAAGALGVVLTVAIVAGIMPALGTGTVSRADTSDDNIASTYFYDQLATADARGIYDTLEDMLDDGSLYSGVATVDLVGTGMLQDRSYDQASLTADFAAGRDAFFMDHASVFYVDGDKLTMRQLVDAGGHYSITMGIGREDTYFRDGFDENNVSSAVINYNNAVSSVALKAGEQGSYYAQVEYAFDYVAGNTSYALEIGAQAAKPENVPYVRTPYGAMVCGEACCEGYARAFKEILDRMGIPCVLVMGTFESDSGTYEEHMWTYVKMDDNRWYMCDPTMQSSSSEEGKYFLVSGVEDLIQKYQADGVISLSSTAYEFCYPFLSGVTYESFTDAFTIEESTENSIWYDVSLTIDGESMGLKTAAAKGYYILIEINSVWYYFDQYYYAFCFLMEEIVTDVDEIDRGTYFVSYFEGAYGWTEDEWTDNGGWFFDVAVYNGTNIHDVSTDVSTGYTASNIYPLSSTAVCDGEPASTRMSPEKTYTVTVRYSEALKPANAGADVGVHFVTSYANLTEEMVNVRDVSYDGAYVTFTFDTFQTYHSCLYYYFELDNLVGYNSIAEPVEVGFAVCNNAVFACPYVEGSFSTVYASTPALIADGDLSTDGWVLEDGTVLDASSSSYKLTLVVSAPEESESEEMIEEIAELLSGDILSSATYDISLGLCNNQVDYIQGGSVKILVPFPEGFSYDSALEGYSFKAYHFGADGPEEIECVVTTSGLVLYCESFSPFAVIVTDEPQTSKNMAVISASGGSASADYVSVAEGDTESKSVIFTADEGYAIDKITLNGDVIFIGNDTKTYTYIVDYDVLSPVGNVLEVTYVSEQVVLAEEEEGFTPYVSEEEYVPDDCSLGNHTVSSWTTVEPACEEDGYVTGVCDICGAVLTEVLPATGHSWDSGVVVIDPTCADIGETLYTCDECGESFGLVIDPLTETGEHSWDSGVVTKEATETGDGEVTYTCTVCGETYTEVIPATGAGSDSPSEPEAGTEPGAGAETDEDTGKSTGCSGAVTGSSIAVMCVSLAVLLAALIVSEMIRRKRQNGDR